MKFRNKKSIPSPRFLHVGWEYEDKLWIFGGAGVRLDDYMFNDGAKDCDDNNDDDDYDAENNDNDNDDNSKFFRNNQLACYNPKNHEWKIV